MIIGIFSLLFIIPAKISFYFKIDLCFTVYLAENNLWHNYWE